MKLLTTSDKLEKEFIRLMRQYNEFFWASAWAGIETKAFRELKLQEEKIIKVVIGIHFYQTHPDFIQTFILNKRVRYMQQPDGTFHPKIYLFHNNKSDWELLIGSGNFTNGAFTINTEATLLISSLDENSNLIFDEAIGLINKTWNEAKNFQQKDLEKYTLTWDNMRSKLQSLSGKYGTKKKKSTPIYLSSVAVKTWDEFIKEVRKEQNIGHDLQKRIGVLINAKNILKKYHRFKDLELEERKFIAGLPNDLEIDGAEDWGFFGSMKGNINFKRRIFDNDKNISNALDEIPLEGQITHLHYRNFVRYFSKALPGNYIATATRLLAMKRPDTFVCFDKANRSALCQDFGIAKSGMTYDRYWQDIIERIYDCEWWKKPMPKNDTERLISQGRAAFLDSLYYLH